MAKAQPSNSPRQSPIKWTDAEGKTRRSSVPGAEYERRGLVSRQLILPGMEDMGTRPLRKWEDMHPDQQAQVESRMRDEYGITLSNAIHNHGVLIDKSAIQGGARGRHFYRGGSDAPEDAVGKVQIEGVAERHGLPTHVVAAMRAALSPRSNVHDEISNMETIINHVQGGGSATNPPKITGLAGGRNAKKATLILEQHYQGVHPLDVTDEKGKSVWNPRTTQKVTSYMQSYTHPDDPGTRTAVDTHAVGGMAPHLPKTAPLTPTGKTDEKGKPFLTPVPKSDPRWVPNQEDSLGQVGSYEFFDYAQRKAAEKRGLSPTEGQSLAWHAERGSRAQQPGTGKGKTQSEAVKSRLLSSSQFEEPQKEKLF